MPSPRTSRCLLVAAAILLSPRIWAQAGAADAQATTLTRAAVEGNYVAKDFRGAVRKLGQAATLCETRGCTPQVQAQIYASLAVVHWNGTEDYDSAVEALHTMVRLDPEHPLDKRFATPELRAALDTAKDDVRQEAKGGSAASPRKSQAEMTAEEKEQEFRRKVEERKAAYAREAADAQKKADADATKYAAEQKKAEAARKIEEAAKAAADKKEAARKAAEDKKEAARKAAEEKKAEAARRAIEAQKAAEEKKAAERKAAEDKKAEDLRKAEEAKKAKEEARLRTPPPVGKLQENAFHEVTLGYPFPIYVKLPPVPPGIEKVRTDVEKVVTEYISPMTPVPQRLELKPLGNGGYGAMLPCEATSLDGELTYFTIAINKYNNLVAIGATPQKPNKVQVTTAMTGKFPHLPGELPPKRCPPTAPPTASEIAAQPASPSCTTDKECPDGGVCAQKTCATVSSAPPMPKSKPRWRGCFGCELGGRTEGAPAGMAVLLAVAAARLFRRGQRSLRRLALVFAAVALAWVSPGCRPPEPKPPPVIAPPDADGDGIPDDGTDKCLNEKEDGLPPDPNDGCKSTDPDGDGIIGSADKCPNEKEDGLPPDPKDGCASVDPDGDGIIGDTDKCPKEPETKNGYQDADGCPDTPRVVVTKTEVKISEKIMFAFAKATIEQASQNLLDEIAFVINDSPQIEYLEVAGHADKIGTDAVNVQLTKRRAQAVIDALVKRQVDARRMRAQGYGNYCPLDSGDSDAAREKNRRVEFKIMRIDGVETGVALGCELATQRGITSASVPKNAPTHAELEKIKDEHPPVAPPPRPPTTPPEAAAAPTETTPAPAKVPPKPSATPEGKPAAKPVTKPAPAKPAPKTPAKKK